MPKLLLKNLQIQQQQISLRTYKKLLKQNLIICLLSGQVQTHLGIKLHDLKMQEKGIKISTGAPDIPALSVMEPLVGMEGFTVYYHTLPDNEVNDWLVKEHKARFNGEVPDLFTPGGMSAAIAIVEALKKSEGDADGNKLIKINGRHVI